MEWHPLVLMALRTFIRAVEDRRACVEYLLSRLPDAEVIWDPDPGHGAFGTFNAALEAGGDAPSLHLEDDITLTRDFMVKIEHALMGHRRQIVQFFSMRPKGGDLTIGSRLDRNFMMTQCFYLPPGYGPQIVAHIKQGTRMETDPGGIDMAVNDWLRSRHEPYWLHVPSLVQHNEGKSWLGPRSGKRQSVTFKDPDDGVLAR